MNKLDIAIILLYFASMIFLGLYSSRKQKGVDDYYVGGKSMGALKIGALWMAGWIGGSSVIGTSSNAYSLGITGIWYVVAIAGGCIVFAFTMSAPIKRISEKLNNITLPELLTNRYDRKTGIMCSITTILAMVGYTAAQFVAGGSILNVLTGWNLQICYVVAAAVIVFYVSTGGLLAVTYTDVLQMILLILGVVVIGVPVVGTVLEDNGLSFSQLPESYFDLGSWGWGTIIALALSTMLSFFTSMDSYTRCIAAKDMKSARLGTIYAAIAVLVIAGASTYLGMAGKLLLPELESSNNVLAMLIVNVLPHGLKGLILVGILCAIMSTADISVLTASANLTKDLYQKFIKKDISEKNLMHIGFICSVLVGVAGALFGWFNQDIMNLLLITFTINSAGLFLPSVCAFFWKKSCASASFVSMISSTVITVAWYIGGKISTLPIFGIDAIWPALGISAALYLIICIKHKQTPEEKEKAEMFFAVR